MAWGTFSGRDGSGGAFAWLVDTVSGGKALGVQQATEGDPIAMSASSGVSVTASSTSVAAQNLSRKRIEVSNSGTAGAWVSFGSASAAVGIGNYLPAGAKDVYYTTAAIKAISTSGTLVFGYVEW